jgi:hypothetical protein
MQLETGDVDVTDGFEGGFGLVTAQAAALSPAAQVLAAERQAAAAAAAAEAEEPFYKKPIFFVGAGLATVGIIATVMIYRKKRMSRTAAAMADLMAEANCVRKGRGGACECWQFPDGNRVCIGA